MVGQRGWQYAGAGTQVQGIAVDISVFDDNVLTPITPAAPTTPPAPQIPSEYTIKSGDTLWDIETTFRLDHGYLYAKNAQYLDHNAQARGFQSSEGGRLIWPGEVISL